MALIALQHFPLVWPPEERSKEGKDSEQEEEGEGEGGEGMGGVCALQSPCEAFREEAAAAAGADRVLLYATSLQSIRQTYSACQRLRMLLKVRRGSAVPHRCLPALFLPPSAPLLLS